MKSIAKLLVWQQGTSTFMVDDNGVINSKGNLYIINKEDIVVAHPMEMKYEDIKLWQKYFTSRNIKQPFEQIWEPVIDLNDIKEDRYKGFELPYYRFLNREKHGIRVCHDGYDLYEKNVLFLDCKVGIKRLDSEYNYYINPENKIEIQQFKIEKYSRQANHIVAYLDQCTIYGLIRNDDVSIENKLSSFTLAQIIEFIKIASEYNSTNVAALLLNYKNEQFSDYDVMDEFTLD